VDQITVLAHRFDQETHFLFFFLSFLMISAWLVQEMRHIRSRERGCPQDSESPLAAAPAPA
jgi:hypothetical protein